MANNKTTWTMNDTQKAFVAEVRNAGANGVTLFELKMAGKDFKSGAVNTLVSKGVVKTLPEKRVFECEVVFNGVVVGHTKKEGVVFVMAGEADPAQVVDLANDRQLNPAGWTASTNNHPSTRASNQVNNCQMAQCGGMDKNTQRATWHVYTEWGVGMLAPFFVFGFM